MTATYLIDGYNLIHALGFLHRADGDRALERSRLRLLQFLYEQLPVAGQYTLVVFDAAKSLRRHSPVLHFKGIEIRFALDEQADDVIELLLEEQPAPRTNVTVVSSDHRLLHAAQRAGAVGCSCPEFLDRLDAMTRHMPGVVTAPPEKAEHLSAQETEHWLQEFGALADDPGFKELFDPYPFADDP